MGEGRASRGAFEAAFSAFSQGPISFMHFFLFFEACKSRCESGNRDSTALPIQEELCEAADTRPLSQNGSSPPRRT